MGGEVALTLTVPEPKLKPAQTQRVVQGGGCTLNLTAAMPTWGQGLSHHPLGGGVGLGWRGGGECWLQRGCSLAPPPFSPQRLVKPLLKWTGRERLLAGLARVSELLGGLNHSSTPEG